MHTLTLLYTTVSSEEEAMVLSEQAVVGKYATCVNIIPKAYSVYMWEGRLIKAQECFVLFKTDPAHVENLITWMKTEHPYTLPTVLLGNVESSKEFYTYIQNHLVSTDPIIMPTVPVTNPETEITANNE